MDNLLIHVVSLGCEKTGGHRAYAGAAPGSNAALADDPADADVIIVNTCGFINDAKQESIDTILEMARRELRRALIVTGCLAAQRPASWRRAPEVDVFPCIVVFALAGGHILRA